MALEHIKVFIEVHLCILSYLEHVCYNYIMKVSEIIYLILAGLMKPGDVLTDDRGLRFEMISPTVFAVANNETVHMYDLSQSASLRSQSDNHQPT